MIQALPLGARCLGDGTCGFRVWAPLAENAEVHILEPREGIVSLECVALGFHQAMLDGSQPGSLNRYRLDMAAYEKNRWWWHLPENGPSSPFARFFDLA